MKIKCVIFDCDGTLVDSEYLCNLALEMMLREQGIAASAHDMMDRFRGGKLAHILQAIQTDHQIALGPDFVPAYRARVEELFERDLQPCDGVREMLEELEMQKCVASSGPIEKVRKALSVTNLSDHFGNNLFSSYLVGSWKPDPGLFLHAAHEMGFQPDECAVIEDSPVGVEAAQSAGMVSVLYDPSSRYSGVESDIKIEHMNQLCAAIVREN
ncbi:MAG: HAD-IA family hydrolase [Cyanobacteria bacterium P01_H01_bin.15]